MSNRDRTNPPAARVKVTLSGPHTHRGKPHDKGDVIDVTQRQKDWLAERGLVQGAPQTNPED